MEKPKERDKDIELKKSYYCVKCRELLAVYPTTNPKLLVRQTDCGHRICPYCFNRITSSSASTSLCPGSDDECADTNLKDDKTTRCDYAVMRELKRRMVLCDHNEQGCDKKMQWVKLEEHAQECQFRLIKCKNKDCKDVIPASKMQQHLAECKYGNDVIDNSSVSKMQQGTTPPSEISQK